MSKLWCALGMVLVLSACGSNEVKQSKVDVEQRRQIAEENAAREARVRQEQQELARMREQQQKREQAAHTSGETEVLVIAPTELADQKEAVLSHTDSLEDGNGPPGNGSIYYDYDAYNVKEDYQALVEAHGKALLRHKELRLRVEGNCDERGSREYNLALGQRRADSVKRALTLLGVPVSQIETVSFGSEKPKLTGHDEEAYAENRRSDLTYSASGKMRQ